MFIVGLKSYAVRLKNKGVLSDCKYKISYIIMDIAIFIPSGTLAMNSGLW
jgi:hypothetical protein